MIVLRPKGELQLAWAGGFQAFLVMESLLHIKFFIPSVKLNKSYFWRKKKNKEVKADSLCLHNIIIVVCFLILYVQEFYKREMAVLSLYR